MDSQLFIQKLAEKVNIKEVEVSIYFETFVFGFATELQTFKKANFDPFGVFEVEKRLEYIEELEDGGKVLIPPCLQVTFSSSAILGVLKLDDNEDVNPIYELFLERYEWSKEATSLFIAQIKSVIKAQLLSDKKSVVPGFGVFEGELGGDIIFIPDDGFAEIINKPFSHFKPVELSCSEKELINVAGVQALPEKTDKKTNQQTSEDFDKEDQGRDIVKKSASLEDKKQVEALENSTSSTNSLVVKDNEKEKETLNSSEQVKESLDLADHVQDSAEDTSVLLQEDEQSLLKEKLSLYDERMSSIEQKLNSKDQVIIYYKRLALILGVFLLAILILWYWSYQLNAAKENQISPVEVLEKIYPEVEPEDIVRDEDSLQNAAITDSLLLDTVIESFDNETNTSLNVSSQELDERLVTSEIILHKLQSGETLRGLSMRYYHTKDKWDLIVKANPDVITDPDRVPEGTLLKIPKAD